MASVGDLIRITACSNLFSQQVCNVFYYVVAIWTGTIDIDDVLEKWNEDIAIPIGPNLSSQLTPGTLKWENVDNPAETVTITGGFAGSAAGDAMPSFVAVSIRLYGETALTRSGWKRLPGIGEGNVANGELGTLVVAEFDDWAATSLVAPFVSDTPGDFALEPVIVGRNPDGSLNLAAVNPIVSAQTQNRVSTQNTRKVGRGV